MTPRPHPPFPRIRIVRAQFQADDRVALLSRAGRKFFILVFMHWEERPLRAAYIAQRLRISYHSTLNYLYALSRLELVVQSSSGWSLTPGGLSLVRAGPERLSGFDQKAAKFSRFSPLTTTPISDPSEPGSFTVIERRNPQNGRFSESVGRFSESAGRDSESAGRDSERAGGNPLFKENLAALAAYGIIPNERTRLLAAREGVDPQYIHAHALQLKAQLAAKNRQLSRNLGLLISVLESEAPAPALNASGHLEGCDCPQCAAADPLRGWGDLLCPACRSSPCVCEEEGEEEGG